MATKSFQARFTGKCVSNSCKYSQVISVGQFITWDKKRKGATMHIECLDSYNSSSNDIESSTNDKSSDSIDYSLDDYKTESVDYSTNESSTKSVDYSKEILPGQITPGDNMDLAKTLADSIAKFLPQGKAQLDEERVRHIVGQEIIDYDNKRSKPTEVIVHDARTQETKDLGTQHHLMPTLLQVLSAKNSDGHSLNIWLTGPAGSGKTTAARVCAEALSLEFRFCGALDNQYGLIGFNDANGKTVRTPFREAYEHGGVFLFDEVDASSPNAILCFNAALANGHCAFPDSIVARHKDCVIVAAANTWGLGATNDYVGRMKLDATFIDRFVQLSWDIDEVLETATCGNIEWSKRVQTIRRKAKDKGLKVVISPRASYYGSALLAAGLSQDQVETMTLKKAMTDDQWNSLKGSY